MTGAVRTVRAVSLRVSAAVAFFVLAPSSAHAQVVSLEPSAAQRCLTPAAGQRGIPTYPFDAWKRGEKGRVLVELVFTTPDKRPAVAVVENEGSSDFIWAVKEHVASYRVPCLETGPARLRFEFVFRPDGHQVFGSDPENADDALRAELLKCVQHSSGQNSAPEYPYQALRAELQGAVLARLRFAAADQPPDVQVLGPPSFDVFLRQVEQHAKGYRLPCFKGPEPLETSFVFNFRLEGAAAFGFKPLDLLTFMGRVRGVQKQVLEFDTTTMACPFDVNFQYLQPYLSNPVREVGNRDLARRPLLAWLAAQELDLPSRSLAAVFADSTVISVPCVRINTKPKETP